MNQRPIKFRVWDNKHKKMYYIIHSIHYHYYNDGSCVIKSVHCSSDSGELVNLKTFKKDDFELMQCTGLHDKNGKEIWDGDIIKLFENSYYEVKWNKEVLGFSFYNGKECMHYMHELWGFYKNDGFEVIGNIYENPELVENKT